MTHVSTAATVTLSAVFARAIIALVDGSRAFATYRFNNGMLLGVTLFAAAKFAESGLSLGLGSPKLEQFIVSAATAVLYTTGVQLFR